MKFNVDILTELVYCYPGDKMDGFEVVQREYIGSRRWSEDWTQVIKYRDRFYRVNFELPATEMQEGIEPYEYLVDASGWVEAKEVFPKEQTIVVYEER